ncbi:4-(cytidine 5'-diphospho)-2-C-methyl-D-erythritol kinase [Pseudothermotoga thermarum]|uniref:4-diphosphocytidyl-2-C-methyl-D-erythritol kinase n=1 Tax=Pseudothermotoga thermarum DSM 5069 TaxID=688269 RepID=F7YW40_9THEM|nr:4-(cytidine 5'-diphospho)-2-C-methyl-D-erythritol kinase [Pseudothermotoga thermarum]AEH50529.1 4-diphosphocytidyl-2-C-methyl-D-erythritol kinase [Pseudothermotoga thermarum DSM 5069]
MVIHSFPVVEKAYAKVNLYLDVLRKREDGYHDIVGLFQTIDLHDVLIIHYLDKPGISVESDVQIVGKNLVEKAYEVFSKYYKVDFGLHVILKKRIPIGGGLGGGSTDAAALLRFFSRIYHVPKDDLIQIASEVGSDVPFLLFGGTAIVEGKGEKITWLEPISGYAVNLHCPGVTVSTKEAYSMLSIELFAKGPKPVEHLYEAYLKRDFEKIKNMSYNIFENVVALHYPQIKQEIENAWNEKPIVAMLTGSGSCVFAVHDESIGMYKFCVI